MDTIWSRTLFTIGVTPVTPVDLAISLALFAFGYLLSKGIKRYGMRLRAAGSPHSSQSVYGIIHFLSLFVFILSTYIALTLIGVDLTVIAVVIGAVSVGIGFGLQEIVNNCIAGILIFLERKIAIGDWIELSSGEMGVVKEIGIRCVTLMSHNLEQLYIPNSEIILKRVITRKKKDRALFRLYIELTVGRNVDVEEVKRAATEALKGGKAIYPNATPEIAAGEIHDEKRDFECVVCVQDDTYSENPIPLRSHYILELERVFTQKGIHLLHANHSSRPFLKIS